MWIVGVELCPYLDGTEVRATLVRPGKDDLHSIETILAIDAVGGTERIDALVEASIEKQKQVLLRWDATGAEPKKGTP